MEADLSPALAEVLAIDDAWNLADQFTNLAVLAHALADDWLGFFPNGVTLLKAQFLADRPSSPGAELVFERQAAQLYGDTAVTRGRFTADGLPVQNFLRVYARRSGKWQAVSVQVVP